MYEFNIIISKSNKYKKKLFINENDFEVSIEININHFYFSKQPFILFKNR